MQVNTRYINSTKGTSLVKFKYLVFTCMPGELPYATQVFVVVFVWRLSSLINSLVCWLCMSVLGLGLFQTVTTKHLKLCASSRRSTHRGSTWGRWWSPHSDGQQESAHTTFLPDLCQHGWLFYPVKNQQARQQVGQAALDNTADVSQPTWPDVIIIIMEICKAPTPATYRAEQT